MTNAELSQTLETAHDEFLSAINVFTPEESSTVEITPGWTAKDMLAHVSRWESICAGYLRYVLADEPIPLLPAPSNQINEPNLAQDRALTAEQVWEQSDTSFAAVMALVESLTAEQIERVLRGPWVELQDKTFPLYQVIGIDTFDHYPMHIKDIQAWCAAHGRAFPQASAAR